MPVSMRRLVLVLPLVACESAGAIGAPCEQVNDCDDGLVCDLHDGGRSCQAPHDDDHTEAPLTACAEEDRDDVYVLGLSKRGAWADVVFVDALPAPPRRGDNEWTVRVTDQQGAPLPDLEIEVDPFMPDHFHGTSIRCEVHDGDAPGEYLLTPLNLFMPGLWEVTLFLSDAERQDQVVFSFCVDP